MISKTNLNIFSGSDISTWKNDVAKFQKAQTFEGTPECSVVRAGMKERFSKKNSHVEIHSIWKSLSSVNYYRINLR